jgi:hypothetical protein
MLHIYNYIFALGLINESEIFSEDVKVNPTFEITLMFVAISFFYLGMLLNITYFHPSNVSN